MSRLLLSPGPYLRQKLVASLFIYLVRDVGHRDLLLGHYHAASAGGDSPDWGAHRLWRLGGLGGLRGLRRLGGRKAPVLRRQLQQVVGEVTGLVLLAPAVGG